LCRWRGWSRSFRADERIDRAAARRARLAIVYIGEIDFLQFNGGRLDRHRDIEIMLEANPRLTQQIVARHRILVISHDNLPSMSLPQSLQTKCPTDGIFKRGSAGVPRSARERRA
jgi:hypothetical protein